MRESAVAATIMIAIGKEGISTSSLDDFPLTALKSRASSILASALSKIGLYSLFSSSSILTSRLLMNFAACGVNGYFARSLLVKTCFPSHFV